MSTTAPSTRWLLRRACQIAEDAFHSSAPKDLTPRQYDLLVFVRDHEPCSQTDLVEASGVDRSTLADVVKRLKDRGLVQRRRTTDDARAYAVKLTDKGRQLLKDGAVAEKASESALKALLGGEVTDLRESLIALLSNAVAKQKQKLAKAA